jgi:hypothetical protein
LKSGFESIDIFHTDRHLRAPQSALSAPERMFDVWAHFLAILVTVTTTLVTTGIDIERTNFSNANAAEFGSSCAPAVFNSPRSKFNFSIRRATPTKITNLIFNY